MRIIAAVHGNLMEMMDQELEAASEGVMCGVREATDMCHAGWRQQVQGAGLGVGLTKSIRQKFYPNQGLNAAGMVFGKSRRILAAFERGAVIQAHNRRYLAIPTPEADRLVRPRVGKFGKITPRTWPGDLPPLRYVPRPGVADLLVIDEMRHTKSGRLTRARTRTGRLGRGAATVVMFVLVRQVTLAKRLDLDRVARRVEQELPELIRAYYRSPSEA